MARKAPKLSFDQTLESLRSHGYSVTPFAGVAGSMLVSKHGAAAVLAKGSNAGETTAFAVHPGILVRGEVARLLDRGFQKFIKTSQYELPATAAQLHAIHAFTEELNLLAGEVTLYNESLGTTSDLYRYDRLQGRDEVEPEPKRPWDLAGGH